MTMKVVISKMQTFSIAAGMCIFLVACGGGSGGSALNDFQESTNKPSPDQSAKTPEQPARPVTPEETPVVEIPVEETPVAEVPAPTVPETPPTEEPAPEAVPVEGVVQLKWLRPVERENGDYLELDEIGGYELRFKSEGDDEYQSVIIEDSVVDSYALSDLDGEYYFEIAAYDANGLYSQFVPLTPYL